LGGAPKSIEVPQKHCFWGAPLPIGPHKSIEGCPIGVTKSTETKLKKTNKKYIKYLWEFLCQNFEIILRGTSWELSTSTEMN